MKKIIDINGKKKTIVYARKIFEESEEFVEVLVKGKSGRKWIEWYPLSDFEDKNPSFILE